MLRFRAFCARGLLLGCGGRGSFAGGLWGLLGCFAGVGFVCVIGFAGFVWLWVLPGSSGLLWFVVI